MRCALAFKTKKTMPNLSHFCARLSDLIERKELRFGDHPNNREWQRNRPRRKRESATVLMAIEYLPESRRDTAVRYLLIAYGRSGKAVLTSPFHGLDQLLETLTLAGVSLEKDEERSLIRDDGSEQHSVLIASNVELRDSQFEVLGLMPVAEN
jgi:hypothetical protein